MSDLEDPGTRSAWLRRLVARARSRARRSKLPFDIDVEDVDRMFLRQDGRCAMSGVPFSLTIHADAFARHPFGPSLDRVSCALGYTRDNVRLVCVAANFGLGQWGDEVFLVIARGAVERASIAPVPPTSDFALLLNERISAALAVLPLLSEPEQRRQRRRIAGLRRALALGPEGLAAAARRAIATKRRNTMPGV